MKKALVKKAVAVGIFVVALLIIDALMNKKNADIAAEMKPATLPVVSVWLGEYKVNTMYGYATKQKEAYTKDSLTPVAEDRNISLVIDTFQNKVDSIAYEVRSADGERLIEGSEITDYQKQGGEIRFSLQLKDLIEENREYSFVTILTMEDGSKGYYYARFIQNGEYQQAAKLDFITWFHDIIYGGGDGQELRQYLESNSQGDNTTFHKVNIHSSLKQVMWGEMQIEKIDEPTILIRDISAQTMSAVMHYTVKTGSGKNIDYYYVEEYYRIRHTPNRMYLLDYERTMDEYFAGDSSSFAEDRIQLGITSWDFPLRETEGGKILSFVKNNRLFLYNTVENKLSQIFSFYDKGNFDIRTTNRNFTIKILNMEDGGNLTFMVAGYMNRGTYEGRVGIAVYYYNSVANLVEEQAFIPYGKAPGMLIKEVDSISYLNKDNHFFLLIGGNLYDINLENKSYQIIVSGLTEETYQVSNSQRMIAWLKENQPYGSTTLVWMNLSNGELIEIEARDKERISALGFMEEDLVYGLVKEEDILTDSSGRTLFPMGTVKIQSQEGKVLKTYDKEGVYVVGCQIENNQITLNRVKKMEDGSYQGIEDDQIASNNTGEGEVNQINRVAVEIYGTIVQILLKNQVEARSLKVLTPKEVIFEGGREVNLQPEYETPLYYVYGPYGVGHICSSSAQAVMRAYEISGSVVDSRGSYVWKKGTIFTRNQIMAIQGEKSSEEKTSLAVCLDTILQLEGISRLTQPMLERGEDAFSILEQSLRQARILDLTGCTLDTVLYYVDQDIPVLALVNQEAMLVIGFNEQNIVLMDPSTGTVYKKGMNDSRSMFEESGNRFITYIRDNT
ncbi:MAG: hypothetical protein MR383_02140 [Lachnospiraceae bacterium]|nr:hypothetical protein [Lachnospiraceae bacterium]